ncbi:MAG: FxSxx-COOH system tetratricopeptide repeat protein [Anaerolineae bacterium]
MPWNPGLAKLRDLLAELYPTEQLSRELLAQVGLPTGRILFSSATTSNWFNILTEADLHDRVGDLVAVACEDFPNCCAELSEAYGEYRERATQLPRASGIASPAMPTFQVPYNRNPNFTGRDELLEKLRTSFLSGCPGTRVQALTGLGGMGKTQLAIEYTYRHRTDYQVIWWLRAEEPAALAADYARLSQSLHLPEAHLTEQPKIIAAVCHWLTHNDGWLLIFDDAADRDSLQDYLPRTATGHALITSRNPAWRDIGTTSSIQGLDPSESVAFLLQRTGQDDQVAASALAEAVAFLPLALEQAAAYIETTGIPLAEYVTLLSTYRAELWDQEEHPIDYPDTVATTWSLSMEQVEEASPAAGGLLRICAFLAPEGIPRDLLTAAAEWVPESLATDLSQPLRFNKALATLRRYSLLQTSGEAWTMHRLVGAVVRDRLAHEGRQQWATVAVNLVDSAFPQIIRGDRERERAGGHLVPHALAASGHAEALGLVLPAAGHLLDMVGTRCHLVADYALARDTLERAVAIGEATLEPHDLDLGHRLFYLGFTLYFQEDFARARLVYEQALAIYEATYGPYRPEVVPVLANLGALMSVQGDHAEARVTYGRVLTIREHSLPSNDWRIEKSRRAVRVLHDRVLENVRERKGQGQWDRVIESYEQDLALCEATLGPDHPSVATRLNQLGEVLEALGNLSEARAAYERALAIFEATPNVDYLAVADGMHNLSSLLHELGDPAGARVAYERALTGYERALTVYEISLGPNRANVATSIDKLGRALVDRGNLPAARATFQRALSIDEAALRPDHPNVARDVNNLSYVLEELGELEGAHAAAARAHTILEASLPAEHPKVQAARRHLETLRKRLAQEG